MREPTPDTDWTKPTSALRRACASKSARVWARARSPSPSAKGRSARSRLTAPAMSSTRSGSKRRPVTPSSSIEGMPPRAEAAQGSPEAMASMSALGFPSESEGSTKQSADRK
jgi:hypothetical protein